MKGFEGFIARRYLGTRRKGAFVRVMVAFARWGIALGVFALVVTLALMNGFREEIQQNLFSATAHFTIQHLSGEVPRSADRLAAIRAVPGVVAASPIRFEKGLLKPALNGAPPEAVAVKAVDPATAGSTSSIFSTLSPRPVTALGEGELLIGKDLSQRMDLRVGEDVALSLLRVDLGLAGLQPKVVALRVAGIFHSHISEYDRNWVFMHLRDAGRLARSEEAEMIEVRAASVEAIDRVKPAVLEALNGAGGGGFVATDLRDTNRPLFAALKLEKWLFASILGLIVLVAAFNIVASLVLLVTEKRRDLGVLLALGATPAQVQRLFEVQGLRIGAAGTAWGLGLSVPFCLVADHFRLLKLPSAVYDFITYVPFRLHLLDLVLVVAFPLLVAWWASRYPARRAASVDPVDALRAE
ncbi:MAG: ABC transporter permease [Acidobacteria bacterium]|nr:ABC transporter permease [Acidobacteriota bacterium]